MGCFTKSSRPQGCPTFWRLWLHWKNCLGPHIKYIVTCYHKKIPQCFKYIYDFVLGHIHSHPEPHRAHGPQAGHPCRDANERKSSIATNLGKPWGCLYHECRLFGVSLRGSGFQTAPQGWRGQGSRRERKVHGFQGRSLPATPPCLSFHILGYRLGLYLNESFHSLNKSLKFNLREL